MVRHRFLLLVLVLAALVLASGCAKKTTPTTAAEAPAALEAEYTAPAPPQPARPVTQEAEPDIWSADLDTLNAYLREKGLLQPVYFDYDRYELRADTRERLAVNARLLRERPELEVVIEGHADERGTHEYNLALGDRRAESARGYLKTLGIQPDQTATVSYGKERPVCTDSAESCWWQNRRAQFVVVGRRNVG